MKPTTTNGKKNYNIRLDLFMSQFYRSRRKIKLIEMFRGYFKIDLILLKFELN